MTMNLADVFKSFCEKLSKREGKMTEDNVRYYWFAAMYEKDNELNHYTLEKPYERKEIFEPEPRPKSKRKKRSRKELDLLYDNGKQQWAMEIKFHRYSPTSVTALPDAAGAIFSDILRLQFAPVKPDKSSVRRLFLYVTDDEMDAYMSKGSGGLCEEYRKELQAFYGKKGYTKKQFFDGISSLETFKKSAFSSFEKTTAGYYYNSKLTLFPTPDIRLIFKKDNLRTRSNSFKERDEKDENEETIHMCHVRLYEVLCSASDGDRDHKDKN